MKYVRRVAQVAIWILLLGSAALAHSLIFLDVPLGAPFNNFFHTEARGLNNRGQVVGMYRTLPAGGRGFLYERGVFTPIYVPRSNDTQAYRINDRGAMVGVFTNLSGSHGFRYDGLYATISGRVLDSASNSHGRFGRAQLQDDLVFPRTDQAAWVRV